MIIFRDDFLFEENEERLFSEFEDYEGYLDQREFGKRQNEKKKLDRATKAAVEKANRARNKAQKAQRAVEKAEAAAASGNVEAASDYMKQAENASNKAAKAELSSKRSASFANDIANKLGKDTPFVVDERGVETRTITGRNGASITQTKVNLPSAGNPNQQGQQRRGDRGSKPKNRTLADKIRDEGRQNKKGVAIVESTHKYQPTSAKNPSRKVNVGGITETKSTKLVNTVVNNVGNEVIPSSPAVATPRYNVRTALIGEGFQIAPLNRNLDPNKVAENARAALAERNKSPYTFNGVAPKGQGFTRAPLNPNYDPSKAGEIARKALEDRAAKEAAAKAAAEKAAEEAAKNQAISNAAKKEGGKFSKLLRNKKALAIGGVSAAALGGLGLYGYKKYKDNK